MKKYAQLICAVLVLALGCENLTHEQFVEESSWAGPPVGTAFVHPSAPTIRSGRGE